MNGMPSGVQSSDGSIDLAAAAVVEGSTSIDAFDYFSDPVALLGPDFIIFRANDLWGQEFGQAARLSPSLFQKLEDRIRGGIVGVTEFRLQQTGDPHRTFQVRVSPGPVGWIITARDVTAEVEHQNTIRSQADWYRRALQAAGEGTWEFDVLSNEFWISPSLKEKLGLRAWDAVNSDVILDRTHPDDRQFFLARRKMALDGEMPLHTEIRLETQIGFRWSLISGAVLRDSTGAPLRIAGMIVDIHERMMIEEQLRELNRALESKVADRTRELAQTNEELQSFCYSVSHDLRGPLRSINGFGKALEEDYGYLFDDQGRDYLRRIRKAAIRLSGLIDGLLNLARITQAGMRREPLNIGEIARELLEDLCRTYPDRKTQIVIRPGLKTYGDANLVRLALANLIENAWKFSSRCEITSIEVGSEGEAFFVRDHGAGFNMEYASKLFAPFERLHTEAEFPGSGLGLAVVQRVVQRHHGTVWAEGVQGEGATVYFTLPARRRDRKGSPTP